MHYTYKTKGTCSRAIDFDMEQGIVSNVSFTDGCNGNLQGLAAMAQGMNAYDIISRLAGISCMGRPTSCPDQFARALKAALEQQETAE